MSLYFVHRDHLKRNHGQWGWNSLRYNQLCKGVENSITREYRDSIWPSSSGKRSTLFPLHQYQITWTLPSSPEGNLDWCWQGLIQLLGQSHSIFCLHMASGSRLTQEQQEGPERVCWDLGLEMTLRVCWIMLWAEQGENNMYCSTIGKG